MKEEFKEIKILISKQELEKLAEMSKVFHQTPEDIVGGIIADLTNSDRSNGEEEHAAAYSWWLTVYRKGVYNRVCREVCPTKGGLALP